MTRRLVFYYSIYAVAMFAITFAFLNWTIRETLVKSENDYLDDRVRVFRAIIESRTDFIDVIKQDIIWEGAYVKYPEYYARIQDSHCRTLVETPKMDEFIPPNLFPDPCIFENAVQHNSWPEKNISYHSKNGRSYILESYWTETIDPSQRHVIQIAVDTTAEKGLIQMNQRRMLLITIPGILFTIFLSLIIAKRVLLPLNELAGLAKRITIDKMGMRAKDPLRWPVELRAPAIAFNEMLERLKNSFAQISQYTSNLAHELRTPINNRKVLESGLEEHMRLARMIDALLFLARSEHPATQLEYSLFDPMDEIMKVCSFYEALAEEKQAQISWDGSGPMYGDPVLFRRAMNNLISNSLYYSSPGVKIDINVRKAGDNFQEVTVNDTGHGISEEDINNVFDRFYRVMGSRSCNPQGSGLGLSIVKFIMELHSGTVTIQSVPGRGTMVTLRFPAPPPETLNIAA